MTIRVFKTAYFAKAAKKAKIEDDELAKAIVEVINGQAVALGNGVYKKRLNKNKHRSIILAKDGEYWIYQYLFAKKDRDNITEEELRYFKNLASDYARSLKNRLDELLTDKELVEVFL
ncbi:MAG: type II toxin-antitoxin system RelE/ParE family toxin [Pseudomonadota bacterium]